MEQIEIDESLLATLIDGSEEVEIKVADGKKLSDYTIVDVDDVSEDTTKLPVQYDNEDVDADDALAGTWSFVKTGQDADAYADYTVEYELSTAALQNLTKRKNAKAQDYVKPTAELNVKVTPIALNIDDAKLVVTPESVPYGTTLGELTVDTSDVTVKHGGKTVKGEWVWAEGNDYVMPVGDHNLEPDGDKKPAEADAKFVLAFRAEEKPLNYSGFAYAEVEVTKATPTLNVTDTTMEYTGNPAALNVVTNSDANEASYTFVWRDENGNRITAAPTEVGSYQVTVTIPETANFESVSKTVDFTITYNAHFDGVEGFVTRLYQVALGRTPDASGYKLWVNGLKSGEYTPEFVAYGFIFSREFTNKNLSNADFLTIMYNTFMDRDPDANGYAMWLNGLNSGEFTREFVFNGFVYSKEFTDICARYGL